MSSFAIASIVFGCSLGAALIGMVLHVKLPDRHLDADSRDVVKLVMGPDRHHGHAGAKSADRIREQLL